MSVRSWPTVPPWFSLGVGMVRDLDWALTLISKGSEDWPIATFWLCLVKCSIDSFLPKTLDGMWFEIRCRSSILGILEAPNTMYALQASALLRSTAKEVVFAIAVVSDLDIRFEEAIYCWAPSFTEPFCIAESVPEHDIPSISAISSYILSSALSLSSSSDTSCPTSCPSSSPILPPADAGMMPRHVGELDIIRNEK